MIEISNQSLYFPSLEKKPSEEIADKEWYNNYALSFLNNFNLKDCYKNAVIENVNYMELYYKNGKSVVITGYSFENKFGAFVNFCVDNNLTNLEQAILLYNLSKE